ncbi:MULTISPECIES: glutaredoxin domain-containing protein [unclassified Sphingomonas]|uniref:glutaredoxin domain-containing protein n=1 Tax=unclassified Sphingomonas TaxID=196159 RepID=UPI00031AADB9|nr:MULTISPECIES: glutaredoxin domain-containing protein [unclassified Sphingomonas]KTF68758.1 glutaredoxin [Sphingomonas sp. WG]
MDDGGHAVLYRMVLPDHVCPFGVRARDLLQERGYTIDDRVLSSRVEVDDAKTRFGVATTPVVFIGDRQIGGADALERYLADR